MIVVTGGTGRAGGAVAAALREAGAEVLVASRTAGGNDAVRFDWDDPATFAALDGAAALLVTAPPGAADPLATMRPALEHARDAGVRRFVLVGAASIEADGPMTGPVYRWIMDNAPEWTILRPGWFMQNFSAGQHLPTIRDERTIYSATGAGRTAFIDVADIGRAGARALTDPARTEGEMLLTGREALTYNEVAAIISDAIGARVEHRRLDEAGMAARFEDFGIPADSARGLAGMDGAIAAGRLAMVTDTVEAVTGRAPTDFATFARANRAAWL